MKRRGGEGKDGAGGGLGGGSPPPGPRQPWGEDQESKEVMVGIPRGALEGNKAQVGRDL